MQGLGIEERELKREWTSRKRRIRILLVRTIIKGIHEYHVESDA